MKIYLNCTANLGDFLNSMPVLSGVNKSFGKFDLVVRGGLRKFKGFKEFLMYQELFNSVEFDDEIFIYGDIIQLSSWTREDKNNKDRPTETCRYENFLKDNYKMNFQVDDSFEIKFPNIDVEIKDVHYVGDRWAVGDIDSRRATNTLNYFTDCTFIDYNNDLLTNCYIIKNSKKPFITSLSGVSVLADLLNKDSYVLWKAEDWNEEFRVGNDINWEGKNIQQVFEKHYYGDRKMKLLSEHDFDWKKINAE